MADIICPMCGEPWDGFHIRNDMDTPVPWPSPSSADRVEEIIREKWATAPTEIIEAAIVLGRAETNYVNLGPLADDHPDVVYWNGMMKEARNILGKLTYDTGLAKGCPACWEDPSRIPTDPDERQRHLRDAIFEGAWDGDPAEFFA